MHQILHNWYSFSPIQLGEHSGYFVLLLTLSGVLLLLRNIHIYIFGLLHLHFLFVFNFTHQFLHHFIDVLVLLSMAYQVLQLIIDLLPLHFLLLSVQNQILQLVRKFRIVFGKYVCFFQSSDRVAVNRCVFQLISLCCNHFPSDCIIFHLLAKSCSFL